MKRSSGEWEEQVEKLINQCADKVILELEEEIMKRLHQMGESIIQDFFATSDCQVPVSEPQDQIRNDDNIFQINSVRDLNKTNSKLQIDKEVWYTFGIIETNPSDIIDLAGMEYKPCEIIKNGNLGMLVCPVPLQEYNEESLHLHLEDIVWVESHARCHEQILLQTMEGRSVIPLPFCTIFTDQANIKRQLAQNDKKIQEDLQKLGNHREMHVKLLIDRNRLLDKLRKDLPYTCGQGGGAYFQKRQWEKNIAEEMDRVMNEYGESLYQDLNKMAAELILLDKNGVVAPEGRDIVFVVQCLIAKECMTDWDKKLEEFDKFADSLGFIIDVSGPWPPYHFVRLIDEEETMGG